MAIRISKKTAGLLGLKTQHKYRAVRTTVDGVTFASKREAKRFGELKILQAAGKISELKLQPKYRLHAPNGDEIAVYVGDFSYVEDGRVVVEDVKSPATRKIATYRLKKKWVKAEYGIEIHEV